MYKGKHIFYSLGNCVFNMPWEPTKYSLMVSVDLASEEVSYQYLRIGNDYFPAYVDGVPEKYSMKYLSKLIDICEDDEKYFAKAQKALDEYRKANKKEIVKNFRRLSFSDLSSMINDFIKRRFS